MFYLYDLSNVEVSTEAAERGYNDTHGSRQKEAEKELQCKTSICNSKVLRPTSL